MKRDEKGKFSLENCENSLMQGEAGVPGDASPGGYEVVLRLCVESSHWLPRKFCSSL